MFYIVACIIGFIVRYFLIPNPFIPLGDVATGMNILFGLLLLALTYIMVNNISRIKKGSVTSIVMFLVLYFVNSLVIYLIMIFYPVFWKMIFAAVVYFAAYAMVTGWLSKD